MSIYYNIGMVVGIAIGLIIAAVLIWFMRGGKKRMKGKYDERQELLQGRGYKYAFFTLLIYYALLAIINLMLGELPQSAALIFFGICLAILVNSAYCIWHECFFALNDRPMRVIAIFGVLGIINAFFGIIAIIHVESIFAPAATQGLINLECTFLLLGIFILILAKKFADRRKKD